MQAEIFISIFNQSIQFISDDWKNKYGQMLNDEHWDVMSKRIFSYIFENEINHNPLPVFNEEIISVTGTSIIIESSFAVANSAILIVLFSLSAPLVITITMTLKKNTLVKFIKRDSCKKALE